MLRSAALRVTRPRLALLDVARTVPPILHTHLPILSLIHTTDSRGHAESFQFAGQLHLEAVGLTGLLRFGCAFDQDRNDPPSTATSPWRGKNETLSRSREVISAVHF